MIFSLVIFPTVVTVLNAAAALKRQNGVQLVRDGVVVTTQPTTILPPRLVTREEWSRLQTSQSAAEIRAINARGAARYKNAYPDGFTC